MNALSRLLSAAALAAVSAGASAQALVDHGILTSPTGMTLYTFDRDTAGTSACRGDCVKLWMPLQAGDPDNASGGSSAPVAMDYLTDYSTIRRDDGTRQWAYRGRPLYLFVRDQKPGDRKGEKWEKVWHVARPSDRIPAVSR